MKPLKLTLTAFGPYKDSETIDFSELEDNNLYVISGNTGAGKTTIFDGICFALYGTASGEDRENYAMLRSDFADDDIHTSAELEFELKGRVYRILRQLGHVKEGNKTKTGERYEFFEYVDGVEVPCVDRQIVSEINTKVEELIGLTEDQFKQIVMLPQGEFRKLLTSETENKEEILRKLFKTDAYKQISERLRQKKSAAEEELNKVSQTRDTYINHIRAVLPARDDSEIFEVLRNENYNVNQVLEGLDKEIQYYIEKMKQDEKAYQTTNKKYEKMQETVQQAKAWNERFEELDRKEEQIKSLTERIPVIKEKEVQLEKAERASKIEPEEDRVREWREDQKTKEKQLAITNQEMKKATESLESAKKAYEQEENNKEKREKITREVNRLKEFYPTVEKIDQHKKELIQLKKTVDRAKTELEQINASIKQYEEMLEKDQEKIKLLEERDSTRLDKHKQFENLKAKVKYVMAYMQAKDNEETFKKELEKQKQIYEQEKERYKQLEATWLNNQAAVLASHIHDGEACPVCGSVHHPEKASHQEGEVSREQLDVFKKKVEKKEAVYQEAAKNHSGEYARLTDRKNDLHELGVPLDAIESTMEYLTKQGAELKEEVKNLDANKEKLDHLKKTNQRLQEDLKGLKKEKETKDNSYQKVNNQFTSLSAAYKERIRTIPEELRDISHLKQKLTEVEKEKQKLEQQWEKVQKDLQSAKEMYTKIETNANHAKAQLVESKRKCKEAEQRFQTALQKADFETEDIYRKARLESSKQKALKEEIKQFNQELATLKEQVRELKETLKDKEKVDLRDLEAELASLKEANEAAFKQWNQTMEYEKQATAIMEKITETSEQVRESEHQFNITRDLHDMIRGQNIKKVSFERFLQMDYLDQIIEAANQRLKDLSNGQYSLIRSDRQEARGKQSGLALDVYDEYTGQNRDVKSLSGGEKFNASLCLALGMSDVIQSYQGNISIDTMFIDEGFGSLDEEALNKSIDTLIDLQETGRMIGVISHVKELKSIFPAVLEVNKTKEGYSETRFLVK